MIVTTRYRCMTSANTSYVLYHYIIMPIEGTFGFVHIYGYQIQHLHTLTLGGESLRGVHMDIP